MGKKLFQIRAWGLKKKLVLSFSVFIILLSIVLTVIFINILFQYVQEKNHRYINDITSQTAKNLAIHLSELEQVTFSLLSDGDLQAIITEINQGELSDSELLANKITIRKKLDLAFLYNDAILSLGVVTNSGTEIISRSLTAEKEGSIYTREDIYAANGTTLWSMVDNTEKDICLSRAILDLTTLKPIAYVNLVCKQKYLGDIMNDISFSYKSGSYLLDQSDYVMSSNLPEKINRRIPELNESADSFSSSSIRLDGEDSIVYKGEELYNGWTLATVIPQNELSKEIVMLILMLAGLDIAVIALMIITTWLLIRKITSPFEQLCRSMEEVGQGNFQKWDFVDSGDEISMLSRSYNEMVENIETLIEQVYELEISKRQGELEMLKMQINPHFLYNTLDTISWLARDDGKEEIAEVALALATLLRANLKQDDFITIRQEMESVKSYLLIQTYRFGSKMSSKIIVEPECEDILIPSFIMQPLVENAIIHGLEPKQGPGKILVKIFKEDNMIKFVIADDGVGIAEETLDSIQKNLHQTQSKSFIGLKNVDKRLCIYYGEVAGIRLESDRNIGTRIMFRIPIDIQLRRE